MLTEQTLCSSHTQEKNYVCETCDKAFTNASDLGKHKLIHDPVKKFRWDQFVTCLNAKFNRFWPNCFRCEECQRHFTQKIHLRKHLEKHHPEIDFDFAMREAGETLIKVEEIGSGEKVIFEEYELVDEDGELVDEKSAAK